jgi:6-phosphogluconolactonase/glucosamine-6-phosphate isomerase/deaminase
MSTIQKEDPDYSHLRKWMEHQHWCVLFMGGDVFESHIGSNFPSIDQVGLVGL